MAFLGSGAALGAHAGWVGSDLASAVHGIAPFVVPGEAARPAARVRLVRPDAYNRLPLHDEPGLDLARLPDLRQCAQWCDLELGPQPQRRSVDQLGGVLLPLLPLMGPERRRNPASPLMALVKQLYRYSISHGIRFWVAELPREVVRSLQGQQLVWQPLAREGWTACALPSPGACWALADLRQLEKRLIGVNPALLEWMRAPGEVPPASDPRRTAPDEDFSLLG
jgi:hypothetical protein